MLRIGVFLAPADAASCLLYKPEGGVFSFVKFSLHVTSSQHTNIELAMPLFVIHLIECTTPGIYPRSLRMLSRSGAEVAITGNYCPVLTIIG